MWPQSGCTRRRSSAANSQRQTAQSNGLPFLFFFLARWLLRNSRDEQHRMRDPGPAPDAAAPSSRPGENSIPQRPQPPLPAFSPMASAATLAAATSSLLRRSSPLLLRRPHGLRISRDVAPRRIGGSKKQETRTRNLELPVPRSVRHIASSTNEESAARAAAETADTGGPTIFDKIIAKQIPSNIVYEDEKVLAFRDINPQAPVHVLVIPKLRDGLTGLDKAEPRHAEILGQLLYAAKVVAEKEGVADGFRVVINNGEEGCQSVYHLHVHVLGGRQMKWPPG
ncbi:hypothetical protein BRADI_1g32219v3 [Brachypodium distachyon]|uniref:HIT domain-containing protein n=2 Tax=Brachypodium distachyon TaxID=15368 RepID=A0A0Q3H3A5_BRADI|nr:hypothetical protein BRADI_1g32219v3 [Brachypodium distachyon]